ncbi:hypothetical protein TNCV_4905881 [Trichonephila clavipes]|uniref:Uncharacterized protein n=1 Tax=Trichonephila clavipes TaxID=2585209 RepID=A0A8X6V7N4_TRICX|nr:hypothetical protein TNCV_4905881 [Trichonephila clavipes]
MISEQRGVIRFVKSECVQPTPIHPLMVTVYIEDNMFDKSVRKCSACLRERRVALEGSTQIMRADTIMTSKRQSEKRFSGSMRRHLLLKLSKQWNQEARYCTSSFSPSNVCYLVNSLSTEESLTEPTDVYFKTLRCYAGPSRTKNRRCS